VADPSVKEPPLKISGDMDRYEQVETDADYVQPRNLYTEVLDAAQRDRLHKNMAAAFGPCSQPVKERWLAVLEKVHPDYAAGVRAADEAGDTDVNAIPVSDDTPVDSND